MTRACWLLVLGVGFFVCDGCGRCSSAADENKGAVVELDGLRSRAPAAWKEERSTSNMRHAQFRAPKADGDKDDAEFVIFYFGPGGGGSNEENIKRWKGQFVPPDGKKIDDVTKVEK